MNVHERQCRLVPRVPLAELVPHRDLACALQAIGGRHEGSRSI